MRGLVWWLRFSLAGACLLLSGCVPPGGGAAGAGEGLYALGAQDGTLVPLDTRRVAIAGPGGSTGRAPHQAAGVRGGGLLVLSLSRDAPGALTLSRREPQGWSASPVFPGLRARRALLAGDRGRYAAVAHHVPPEEADGGCRLAVLDVQDGGVREHRGLCRSGEQVVGLALRESPAGAIAYLGLGYVRRGEGSHRVVALDALSGGVWSSRALTTAPAHLQLGAAPGEAGAEGHLYLVEGTPGAESEYSTQGQWRLLALDPATLEERRAIGLRVETRGLTVAPDGSAAYALLAGGRDLLRLDLHGGAVGRLGALPGHSAGGMAVAGGRLYVPGPLEDALWVLDGRDGRLLRTLRPGRRPVAVVAAGGGR